MRGERKIDPDLQEMLDKLNSKQRRKLCRLLQRKDADVDYVRVEVQSLLPGAKDEGTPKKKAMAHQLT
jgi:hypothetical protein